VLVVVTVFVAARVTTFDRWIVEVPNGVRDGIFYSGFLGVVVVAIIGQLTPQILASSFPMHFLNMPGFKYVFYLCLGVEMTGVAQAVWLLSFCINSMFTNILCKKKVVTKTKTKNKNKNNEIEFMEVGNEHEHEHDDDEDDDGHERKMNNNQRLRQTHIVPVSVSNDILLDVHKFIRDLGESPQDPAQLFETGGGGGSAGGDYPSAMEIRQLLTDNYIPIPSFLLPSGNHYYVPPRIALLQLCSEMSQKK
jgi:hypothetical protein